MNRVFILMLFVLVAPALAQSKLTRRSITPTISVKLPEEFTAMTPEDISLRYPSVRQPLGAFTDKYRLADFSVNVSATQWPDGNAEFARSFFKASIMNMFDKVDVLSEGIWESKKKKYIFFEFDSRMRAERKGGSSDPLGRYTYIMYLVEPKRTLVISFNCLAEAREQWKPVASEIMHSIRVR